MALNHAFTSAIADGADATLVRPSNWNADHVVSGTSLQILFNNAGSLTGMSGTSWDDTNRSLTLTGATVTTSNPILNLSQVWNAAGVAFDGLVFNVTNTASAAGSRLLSLQIASKPVFDFDKAATFRVYNTYTDASNYERGVFDWTTTANTLTIGTQAAGTGTLRSVSVRFGSVVSFAGASAVENFRVTDNDMCGLKYGTWLGALTTGDICIVRDSAGVAAFKASAIGTYADLKLQNLTVNGTVKLQGYTVATLPTAGTAGRRAYVTDATAPTYNGALTGGGAIVVPVFDNGTAWVSA